MCVAVVTMRLVFPGAAPLARAWDLRNVETWVVKATENPLTSLITAALSPSRRARLTIFKSYRVKSSLYGVGCQIRRQAGHGAAHSLATYLEAAEFISRLAAVHVNAAHSHFSSPKVPKSCQLVNMRLR